MASVTNLDQDVRAQRRARYTPQAANALRSWFEEALGEKLPAGDLLEGLKDGLALCKVANMALPPPGVKFKKSNMPFVQMENISQFLKACAMPPLDMHAHDRFLTVDLYEMKDPAQVLTCLNAFTRQAHLARPDIFPEPIGPKAAAASSRPSSPTKQMTPRPGAAPSSAGALSPTLTGGSNGSHSSSQTTSTTTSSNAPAWNIHQYGYMGGASQGNQGINFGVRRQITSAAPNVPSLAEKERQRKEKAAEEEKMRQQAEDDAQRRQAEQKADEEREKEDEERRWEEQTHRKREEERQHIEDQKRQWEDQERRWKEDEAIRKKEDAELEAKLSPKDSVHSNSILRGQSLSQYQSERSAAGGDSNESPEQKRVRDLEKQLEEAKERERQYQAEREERVRGENDRSRPSTAQSQRRQQPMSLPIRPLPEPTIKEPEPEELEDLPAPPPQDLPASDSNSSMKVPEQNWQPKSSPMGSPTRPEPTPEKQYSAYSPEQAQPRRPSPFAASPAQQAPQMAPVQQAPPRQQSPGPRISNTQETGDASLEQHRDADNRRAINAQTKAASQNSKSLLEREMERERERQREWEADQQASTGRSSTPTGPRQAPEQPTREANFTRPPSRPNSSRGMDFGSRRPLLGPRPQK